MKEGRESEGKGEEEGEGGRKREGYVIWGLWRCRNSGEIAQPLSLPAWLFCSRHCGNYFLCSITGPTPSRGCGFLYFKDEGLDLRMNTSYSLNEKQTKFSPNSIFTVPNPLSFSMLVSFQNIPKVSPCLIESHMTALKVMDGPYSPTIPLYRWEAKGVLGATCILSKAQSWARNQDDSLHLHPPRVFLLGLKGSVRTTTEGDLQPSSGFFMASPCNGMHRLNSALREYCNQTFLKFFRFAIFFFFNTVLICRKLIFFFVLLLSL